MTIWYLLMAVLIAAIGFFIYIRMGLQTLYSFIGAVVFQAIIYAVFYDYLHSVVATYPQFVVVINCLAFLLAAGQEVVWDILRKVVIGVAAFSGIWILYMVS